MTGGILHFRSLVKGDASSVNEISAVKKTKFWGRVYRGSQQFYACVVTNPHCFPIGHFRSVSKNRNAIYIIVFSGLPVGGASAGEKIERGGGGGEGGGKKALGKYFSAPKL